MSEPKFTPGEWEVYHIPEDKGGKYEVSSNESPWWIALVGAPNENYEQAKANANLMAASKEMYYVLKRIIDDLPTKRDWLDPVLERMAKDALAKAEGGTHADLHHVQCSSYGLHDFDHYMSKRWEDRFTFARENGI